MPFRYLRRSRGRRPTFRPSFDLDAEVPIATVAAAFSKTPARGHPDSASVPGRKAEGLAGRPVATLSRTNSSFRSRPVVAWRSPATMARSGTDVTKPVGQRRPPGNHCHPCPSAKTYVMMREDLAAARRVVDRRGERRCQGTPPSPAGRLPGLPQSRGPLRRLPFQPPHLHHEPLPRRHLAEDGSNPRPAQRHSADDGGLHPR